MNNFKSIKKKANIIKSNLISKLSIDKNTKVFIKHNKIKWQSYQQRNPSKIILVDFVKSGELHIARSYFLNILAQKHSAAIRAFNNGCIFSRCLKSLYFSYNVKKIITPRLNNSQKKEQLLITKNILFNLKTKNSLLRLHIFNLWLGMDIYETYLKKFCQPTVRIKDSRLHEMIKDAVGLTVFWRDYFKKNQITAVVVSHDAYLNYNVVCKLAYQHQIPVYLPNLLAITKISKPYSLHNYFQNYRKIFKKLNLKEQKRGLLLAKKQLDRRLKGEIGVDMPYSEKSAFKYTSKEKTIILPSKNIKVLICSHCFYDNPHAYKPLFFPDFYEWLEFLNNIAKKTNYDWYLKTHPDPLPGTEENIKKALGKDSKIKVLPNYISHQQLAKEGIDFVLTAYGTVGHEYPLLGVQVINAGYNPQIAYNFNWHPRNIKEYKYLLLNLQNLKKKKINLKDIYEFYYMHYYYRRRDNLIFKSYRQMEKDLTMKQRMGSKIFNYFLRQLTSTKHQIIIGNMREYLESGRKYYFYE